LPGRLSLTATRESLQRSFPGIAIPDPYQARYNIAPKLPVAVITNANPKSFDYLIWGMIPSWETGVKMTRFLINARSETIAKKPSFKASLSRRRCLIPADGYFEWVKLKGVKAKRAYYIYKKDQQPFAFAGIWDSWQSIDGSEIISFATITTPPNKLVSKIHHRMGAILEPKYYDLWLSAEEISPETLLPFLRPYPADQMAFHRVSNLADDPKNDYPQVIEAIEKQGIV